MMDIRPETDAYLIELEKFAARKFQYRREVGILIDLAEQRSMQPLFEQIIFLAKFASSSFNILKRSGVESEETAKLSTEYAESLRKITSLLELLTAEAPNEITEIFQRSFLNLSHESVNRFMALLYELSWVKNSLLDNRRPPFSPSSIS
ncbi:MAG: hypothetical protein HY033_02500 [Ignavibacteriae bacterium]|nr:hypothetical protein [Ignavibacteria bacterium]MBI3363757.1 hypothetical protein [Ignavibacteriota bacterium]